MPGVVKQYVDRRMEDEEQERRMERSLNWHYSYPSGKENEGQSTELWVQQEKAGGYRVMATDDSWGPGDDSFSRERVLAKGFATWEEAAAEADRIMARMKVSTAVTPDTDTAEPTARDASIAAVRQQGYADARTFDHAEANTENPVFLNRLAAAYPELSRDEVRVEYVAGVASYAFEQKNAVTEDQYTAARNSEEPAGNQVQVITRGRELAEQERFEEPHPSSQWTLQQYGTNPAGEPWFALQKQDESGETRTLTGTREELRTVAAEHGLTPLELPPAPEGSYYRQPVGSLQLSPEIRRDEGLSVSV